VCQGREITPLPLITKAERETLRFCVFRVRNLKGKITIPGTLAAPRAALL
jgi:hypothetical protein